MKVTWHKWPDEKPPKSRYYWITVAACSAGGSAMYYVKDPMYYRKSQDQFVDFQGRSFGGVIIAWADAETPDPPNLKVQTRQTAIGGFDVIVEWLDEQPPEGSIEHTMRKLLEARLSRAEQEEALKRFRADMEQVIANARKWMEAQ